MENNQARIIELLREVHLIAFKEIERLNLRIAELESEIASNQHRKSPTKLKGDCQWSPRHRSDANPIPNRPE